MALSITDQQKIRTSVIRPDEMTLLETISIAAYTHAQFFIDNNLKETDPGSLAESYKNKMLQVANQVKQKNGTTLLSLVDAFINILKNGTEQAMNLGIVRSWDQSAWNNQVSDRIAESMEVVAGVLPAEKQAYSGLQ